MPNPITYDVPRPPKRLTGNLAAGAATSNGGILWEAIPVRGSARVKVRIKTATNGGTLDLFFVGPNFDWTQAASTAYASLAGTIYATGNPAQVTVTAGTEAQISTDCYGESAVLVKFTGSVGAGTITFCDVSQV